MEKKLTLDAQTLELLGLKEKDLHIYVTLIGLGSAPLRRVAEAAGLNRGTTYDALKRLMQQSLVSFVDAKSHRYFTAEDPNRLRGLATRREVAIADARIHLTQSLIPSLLELAGSSEHRPAVRYFEGESGVRDLLEDVLVTTQRSESKTYRVYSSASVRDLIRHAWPSFTKERITRRVQVKTIAIGDGGETQGLDERRWLTKKDGSPTYIFVYPGKTAYVSVDAQEQLFGVTIQDGAISATQQLIFEALWESL